MLTDRWKKKTKVIVTILALSILVIYGYFQAQELIAGPVVEIKYPKDSQQIKGDIITTKGSTRNVSKIEINGHPIFITPEGDFSKKLPLLGARTIIQIEAWDRFGRSTLVKREVTKEEKNRNLPSLEDLERRVSGKTEKTTDEETAPDIIPVNPENS
ncbi:MAG: hypothetical protein ACQESA_03075 [Patescibacteria group bacterium]